MTTAAAKRPRLRIRIIRCLLGPGCEGRPIARPPREVNARIARVNGPTLVVGATGMLGGAVCRRLAAAGKPVRALVRSGSDPQRVEALRETGAETVLGDLKDDASLAAACNGAAAVITTAQTVVSRQ